MKQMNDPVNHPSHYTNGKIECIEAIEAALTPEEFRGYLKGNAIKYIWRERMKGNSESLAKANWYVTRLLDGVGGSVPDPVPGNAVKPTSKVPPCAGYEQDTYMYGVLGANTSFGGTD